MLREKATDSFFLMGKGERGSSLGTRMSVKVTGWAQFRARGSWFRTIHERHHDVRHRDEPGYNRGRDVLK